MQKYWAQHLAHKFLVVAILGYLLVFVTQAYPKGPVKAITNTTKEW